MDELELIDRARRGDGEAFDQLVRIHQASVRAFAACFLMRGDDVWDVVQDTFLHAFQNINAFDTTRDFRQWLLGICRNDIRKHFRSQRTRTAAVALVESALEVQLSNASVPNACDETVAMLRLCVDELHAPHRQMLALRYERGVSIKEIAEQFKRSDGSISMLLMRIRSTLLRCVERRRHGVGI